MDIYQVYVLSLNTSRVLPAFKRSKNNLVRVVKCMSDSFTVLWTYDNKKRTKQASLLASVSMPSTKTHIPFIWFQVLLRAR